MLGLRQNAGHELARGSGEHGPWRAGFYQIEIGAGEPNGAEYVRDRIHVVNARDARLPEQVRYPGVSSW